MIGDDRAKLDRLRLAVRAQRVVSGNPNALSVSIRSRGYLPHLLGAGAAYFVTFRLADSLPQSLLERLMAEHHAATRSVETNSEHKEANREYFRKMERSLDTGLGACWLGQPRIARILAGAFLFFEGTRYHLDAWVVMPNHAHAVVRPAPEWELAAILHSWKVFTGREANRILNRRGCPFWQPESYDHCVRNPEEHARRCAYIVNNPVKAGLCNAPEQWRWSSAWREETGAKP